MANYYFNLPPITQLTIDQQAALNETRPISLSGGPGTGKSVVSLWRHISNHKQGKKSLLLTYTTTLAKYLELCSKSQDERASYSVSSSLRWMNSPRNYQEIIVDEAQDLPQSYYKDLQDYSDHISYGADDSQILFPESSCIKTELEALFPDNRAYILSKNFRSTQKIMLFAQKAFREAFIPNSIIEGLANNPGELPVLLISGGSRYETSNKKQNDAIIDLIDTFHSDTHNIAVLVPWRKHVDYFYEQISAKFDCVKYHEGMNGCDEIGNIHITTFKSAKGLEFDTVIIPNFDKMLEDTPAQFHLQWQDFYVGVTRARSNLYLISNRDINSLITVTDKQIL